MGDRSRQLTEVGDDFAWSLLDAIPDAVVIASGSGEIVFVNDRASVIFGCRPSELVGRVVDDLLPSVHRAAHRADRTRYRAEPTMRPMGTGLDLRALRADGTEFPVEISLSPIRLGEASYVLAAVRDITDRVRAEDHWRRVLRTLDASDDGMFIFDAGTLQYSFVNDGAVRLVGYGQDELLSMTPLHINPSATVEEYQDIIDELVRDPSTPVVRRTTLLHRDGREVPVEKTYQTAMTGSDGGTWVVCLARDVTGRLAAEERLLASQAALREAEQDVAVADDRERIARDLHDTVIQRLFGEGLRLEAVVRRVDQPARARIESVIEGLDDTIKELRMAIFSLQRTGLAPGGLRGQLLEEVTAATDALGVEPRLQFDGPIESIDGRIAEHLLPVLRESLANVARHAQASRVRVAVLVDDHVTLTVTDDGIGVPLEVLGGHGLENMGARAAALDGHYDLTRGPSGGTILRWRVPANRVETPEPVA